MKLPVEDVARICHEANRGYCEAMGDNSQVPWEEAEQWQRDSAINGVQFHSVTPNSTPEDSHNNWLQEKVDGGWVYGEIKDATLKTHPCMLPYADLPVEQRAKDYIFVAIVKAFV